MKTEEEHIEVREKLLKLPRVNAREGFENNLLRRINLLDTDTVKSPATKSSFWLSLFGKKSLAWTIPATSLAIIAIVFVGVYFAFYNSKDLQKTSTDKSSPNQQSSVESLKINPLTSESVKNEIPGKDIANDLEINNAPKVERKSDIDKGLNEMLIEQTPKPIVPSKINVIDSKKESTIYEKADDVGKTDKSIKQSDEKGNGINKGVLKEEKKTEESVRSKEPEKKISSPLLKEPDKNNVKTEKSDGKTNDKQVEKTNEKIFDKSQEKKKVVVKDKQKDTLKEKPKEKEKAKGVEEQQKKKEVKDLNKESLEKLKEKIKEN